MTEATIVVTGATGLIGNGIARALTERSSTLRAVVRDREKAQRLLPTNVELVVGDIATGAGLDAAMRGADLVFHSAGMPEQWQRDEGVFDRVNREGTKHVLAAASRAGVRRVVYTSTMDVFAAPKSGTVTEAALDPEPKGTAYERSKQAAEREAETLEKAGLDVVYLNPGAVYGPSPILSTLNLAIHRLLVGKVPMLPPGGMSVAYLDGVVQAHLAAAERGRRGQRYLVADGHVSMPELARLVLEADGNGRGSPRSGPEWLMRCLANVSAPWARCFGTAPLIARGELTFLLWDVRVDASKAQRELGFVPTEVGEGIRRTVEHLKAIQG